MPMRLNALLAHYRRFTPWPDKRVLYISRRDIASRLLFSRAAFWDVLSGHTSTAGFGAERRGKDHNCCPKRVDFEDETDLGAEQLRRHLHTPNGSRDDDAAQSLTRDPGGCSCAP